MKRSEAAAKLKILLTDKPLDSKWIYTILDAVEEIGMLPPTTFKIKNTTSVDKVNTKTGVINFTTSQSCISINEWDEE